MAVICQGCHKLFKFGALRLHQSHTNNPACRAIYELQRAYLPGADLEDSGSDGSLTGSDKNEDLDNDEDLPAQLFAGDYFGDDYAEEDLPGWGGNPEHFHSDSSDSDSSDSESELELEPPPAPTIAQSDANPMEDEQGRPFSAEERRQAEEDIWMEPVVCQFPGQAGETVEEEEEESGYVGYKKSIGINSKNNPYAPFKSKLDWEIAQWAKLRGPSSTAVTELMGIENLHETLGLSYKNSKELNKVVDTLPSRPKFHRSEIIVGEEVMEMYHRDILECVRALYGDPEFSPHLVFIPERHYTDQDQTKRVYSDMHTGKWWWEMQRALEADNPGATIVPVIISSDKTQLTLFRNKAAYPVYLTIGNLPKELRRKPSRRGQILLGYLPTSRLESFPTKAGRRRALANLFHACMNRILDPLKVAGVDGVEMRSGDGALRRIHPLFAIFIGDYPEQLLVTCCKNGTCPKCSVDRDLLGVRAIWPPRDLSKVFDALDALPEGPTAYKKACRAAGIKDVQDPFWADLPYVNIFQSITSDILHQLYQGVIKHLVSWVTTACGATEIDARCRRLPPNHNLRHFAKGISTLSRVSGKEHADMCRILMGLIVDIRLPDGHSPARLVRAVRALLDFLYISQFPSQTDETLVLLDTALSRFHENKSIFIDLGIRSDFNFPKLHSLDHYVSTIKLYGTTDNYNTETSERLHIDFAKDAYRATNRKDEYPQMTLWLERKEKIFIHQAYIQWRLDGEKPPPTQPPQTIHRTRIKMTRHPTLKAVSLADIINEYGAFDFRQELCNFVAAQNHPEATPVQLQNMARNVLLPFQRLPVFHSIKFWLLDPHGRKEVLETLDVAHARPRQKEKKKVGWRPAEFDTVLVKVNQDGDGDGVQDCRVAQVRVVFCLNAISSRRLFPDPDLGEPKHLAYVEWFSKFPDEPDDNYGMYKISREMKNNRRLASIIPVSDILRTVHLYPQWGPAVPREWTTHNILDRCSSFYVSDFLDRHTFVTLY